MSRPKPEPLDSAPLAYENDEFINSPDGRLFRMMAEYSEPMARFRRQRIEDTVVFFGSARFRALDEASHALQLLENSGSAAPAPDSEQPASPDEVERLVNSIVQRLESGGESEVPSSLIGEMVMEGLKDLDEVAYIRFASVYRNFREGKDFEKFVGNLD